LWCHERQSRNRQSPDYVPPGGWIAVWHGRRHQIVERGEVAGLGDRILSIGHPSGEANGGALIADEDELRAAAPCTLRRGSTASGTEEDRMKRRIAR
jgi:hypothetical protein